MESSKGCDSTGQATTDAQSVLALFTEPEVERGETVTLEHVPPQSFSPDSIAMCLTCKPCNQSASRAEQVATQDELKGRLDIAGLPLFTARVPWSADDSVVLRISSRSDITPRAFDKALRESRTLTFAAKLPTAHEVSVPLLKSAYLSVFSLLGVHGYKYAEGAAVEAVREQIMKQEEEIIPRFAAEASMRKQRDGILASRKTPGWVVKMDERVVLLPRGWDQTFYERIGSQPADEIAIGDGPFWFPARFGANRRVRVLTLPEGHEPLELLGEDVFGSTRQLIQDGKTTPYIVVDCHGQEVTIMITAGPKKEETEETPGSVTGTSTHRERARDDRLRESVARPDESGSDAGSGVHEPGTGDRG